MSVFSPLACFRSSPLPTPSPPVKVPQRDAPAAADAQQQAAVRCICCSAALRIAVQLQLLQVLKLQGAAEGGQAECAVGRSKPAATCMSPKLAGPVWMGFVQIASIAQQELKRRASITAAKAMHSHASHCLRVLGGRQRAAPGVGAPQRVKGQALHIAAAISCTCEDGMHAIRW